MSKDQSSTPTLTAPQRVTMKDVAEQCGVSLSTVSLVLSGDARIPSHTTQRVLEVVKAMGYRPNVVARNLARQRTKTIGVVMPDPEAAVDHSFFAEALKGIYAETSRYGYRLLLEIATPQFVARRFYLRLLKENSVDGLIYLGATLQDDFLRDVEPFHYPFLLVGGYLDDIQLSYTAVDNDMAGFLITKHFVDLGHTAIGHVAGPAALSSSRDRVRGYRRALEGAGLPYRPELVVDGHYTADGAKAGAERLLQKGATAIFAGNDLMAAGAMQAVKAAGRRIPEDVAVAGLGDFELAELMDPPLTTVHVDARRLAAEATRKILNQADRGLVDVFQEKHPVRLVTRASSGRDRQGMAASS